MNQSVTSLFRLPRVREASGLSKSTIYARMGEGTFPAAVRLGPRSVAWRSEDITAWIAARPSVRPRQTGDRFYATTGGVQ